METNSKIKRRPISDSCLLKDIHPVLSRIYAARGILNSEEIEHELIHLSSWEHLLNAKEAGEYLADLLLENKKMLIIGDFDADGATSTAVAMRILRALKADVHYLVPDRFIYGYGLTPGIVTLAHEKFKPDLIITVDNGISSLEGVEHARALGMAVLITDHHLPGPQLPNAHLIVNPNQPGDPFVSKSLAGVGVIFYVLLGLRSALEKRGFFKTHPKPNMAEVLDIVALGTVADVVSLDQTNRILVEQGLRRIRKGKCIPGIQALLKLGKRDLAKTTSSDLGFVVGPRINAAGRLEDMSIGIECLIADVPEKAEFYAQMLHELNGQRKAIESDMQEDAMLHLDTLFTKEETPSGICLYDPAWHQGIIGIVASRIKDHHHRPVFVFAEQDEHHIKGSGRSIPGFHLKDALTEIDRRHPQLLEKFGGHAMAAGLSLKKTLFNLFHAAFLQLTEEWLTAEQFESSILSDGTLDDHEYDLTLARLLQEAGPWGQGFPEPLFDDDFSVLGYRILAEQHLKLTLVHPKSQKILEGIYFNFQKKNWDPSWQSIKVAFRLNVNTYQKNETLQLMIEHLEPTSVGS